MKERRGAQLFRIIRILFGSICCGTLLILLIVDKNIEYSELCRLETGVSNVILWFVALGLLTGLSVVAAGKFLRPVKSWCGKHFVLSLLGMAGVLLAVQLLVAYEIYFMTGWDAGIVYSFANNIASGAGGIGNHYYYSQYVNNIGITFMLAVVQKLAMLLGLGSRSYFVCVAVGCLLVNLACVFTALAVHKVTGSVGWALAGFAMMGLVAGLSPWITVPYTDVYSVVFPPLTFYLFLCAREKRGYAAIPLYLLTGLAGGVGFLVKPSAGIVLIAVVCVMLWELLTVKEERKAAFCAFLGLAVALLLTVGLKWYMESYTGCELNEDLQFSLTHYLMMGLNEENTGGYYSQDYGFSSSFATKEERMRGNLQVVGERLAELGVSGYGYFLVQKLLNNFNDGTFSWWMEGGFFQKDMGHHPEALQQLLRSLFYKEGALYSVYAVVAQGVWLAVQTLVVCSLWCGHKERLTAYTVMWISLVGMFLFVMLFEARGRYLYCMLGMYCVCAVVGWKRLAECINNIRWDKSK